VEHVDELIAGYALHALDADDQRIVVAHIGDCRRCQQRLREYEGVAAALAHAAPAADPPPQLRERLLEAIGPSVVSSAPAEPEPAAAPVARERRWSWWPRFSAVAVPALAAIAIGLAIWNVSLRSDLSDRHVRGVAQMGRVGSVVSYSGGSVSLFGRLKPAPPNHVYEAWVIPAGQQTPEAAGTFAGGRVSLTLTQAASPGDTIVVTLEPGHGGDAPKGPAIGKTVLS
jgi:anti-sigma-K factor RskA